MRQIGYDMTPLMLAVSAWAYRCGIYRLLKRCANVNVQRWVWSWNRYCNGCSLERLTQKRAEFIELL